MKGLGSSRISGTAHLPSYLILKSKGATKKGLYSVLDKIIKTGSKIAINISEKI